MTKSFTINAPEYQAEQKKFYAYNVANDESIINAASIKKATFCFHLTSDNLVLLNESSENKINYVYQFNEENSNVLFALREFYITNYERIINMTANAEYAATAQEINFGATKIFTNKVDAYIANADGLTNGVPVNDFILTCKPSAKNSIMQFTNQANIESILTDEFIFRVTKTLGDNRNEKCVLITYNSFFTNVNAASSDIYVSIYYTEDKK